MNYVVFCRIVGVGDMPAKNVAGAVEQLSRITEEVQQSYPNSNSYSSVYGRFVVLPNRVVDALQFAKSVLDRSAEAGVRLAVGVACGSIDPTVDLTAPNVAGSVINYGARLAFLEGATEKIAIQKEVVADAIQANADYPLDAFSCELRDSVKQTFLVYHFLKHPSPRVMSPPVSESPSETAYIVVYDIVGYSGLEQRDQVHSIEQLNYAVRRALEGIGLEPKQIKRSKTRWYAPAGDGGVLVCGRDSGSVRAAWIFAKVLLDHSDRVAIRVGMSVGQIVLVEGHLPVGFGVLDADRLSSRSKTGAVCISRRYWESELTEQDRPEWIMLPSANDEELVLVPPRQAVKELIQSLKNEPDGTKRYKIYISLGRIGGKMAEAAVQNGLSDPNEFARLGAEEAWKIRGCSNG